MKEPILSEQAESDLDEIWLYIAQDSPKNADRFIDRILDECQMLAEFQEAGTKRKNLRMYPVGDYKIYYQPIGNNVEIIRILHAKRRFPILA